MADRERPPNELPVEPLESMFSLVASSGLVLFGGIGVGLRTQTRRSTLDVDCLGPPGGRARASQVARRAGLVVDAPSEPFGLRVLGRRLDVLETDCVAGDEGDLGPREQMFLHAHRFAYEAATPLGFTTASGDEDEVLVATIGGLVVSKVSALAWPWKSSRRSRREGDFADLVALLEQEAPNAVAASVVAWSSSLSMLTVEAIRSILGSSQRHEEGGPFLWAALELLASLAGALEQHGTIDGVG